MRAEQACRRWFEAERGEARGGWVRTDGRAPTTVHQTPPLMHIERPLKINYFSAPEYLYPPIKWALIIM